MLFGQWEILQHCYRFLVFWFSLLMFSAFMVLLLSLYEQDVLVIGFVGNGMRCSRTGWSLCLLVSLLCSLRLKNEDEPKHLQCWEFLYLSSQTMVQLRSPVPPLSKQRRDRGQLSFCFFISLFIFFIPSFLPPFIPSLSPFLPSLSHFLPSLSPFLPSLSIFLPFLSSLLPSLSPFLPSHPSLLVFWNPNSTGLWRWIVKYRGSRQ